MNTRSSRSMVTFSNAFILSSCPGGLPAGEYEVVVEEEHLQGLNFEAYRRIATYLRVRGRGNHAGRAELRTTTERELELALGSDLTIPETTHKGDAALPPLKDMK